MLCRTGTHICKSSAHSRSARKLAKQRRRCLRVVFGDPWPSCDRSGATLDIRTIRRLVNRSKIRRGTFPRTYVDLLRHISSHALLRGRPPHSCSVGPLPMLMSSASTKKPPRHPANCLSHTDSMAAQGTADVAKKVESCRQATLSRTDRRTQIATLQKIPTLEDCPLGRFSSVRIALSHFVPGGVSGGG